MEAEPGINYQDSNERRRLSKWKTVLWVSVVGVIAPPLFGVLATLARMVEAFDKMGMASGSNPESLANDISLSLGSTVFGLIASMIAIPFLILAIVKLRKSKRSF